jgi:glutathione S-transferase
MSKPILSYFAGRGRAEVVRLTLAEAKVDYVDNRLSDINDLKKTGKLAFEQVPLYEDGSLVLVQSATIARYVANKYGLHGANIGEGAQIDMLYDGLTDFAMARSSAKTDEEKAKFNEQGKPKWLGYFESILKRNANGMAFFVGDKISLADIAMYNVLENEDLNAFPLLKAHRERIAARPNIADWLKKRPVSPW